MGVFLAACALLPGCGGAPEPESDVVARGERLLGISISDRADGDFGTAYAQARAAGMQVTSLSLAWDDLETAPGVYAPDPDFLAIAASFYPTGGTKLVLGINPIDTNVRRVPSHLAGLAWDDTRLISAFKALLDWALPRAAPLDLVALSIGNEIDATLATPADWTAFQTFWREVAAHARTLRPGLRVSSKVTYAGLTGPLADEAAALNAHTDLVLTTYYPLNADFTTQPASAVEDALAEVATRYPGRRIAFAEIGAPSSSMCGSSLEHQAAFVRAAFRAWDRHADQIELLEFTWMHDISSGAIDTYEAYYGVSDPCFLAYLGTLGLKKHDGEDKPAWLTLREEAGQRGW